MGRTIDRVLILILWLSLALFHFEVAEPSRFMGWFAAILTGWNALVVGAIVTAKLVTPSP